TGCFQPVHEVGAGQERSIDAPRIISEPGCRARDAEKAGGECRAQHRGEKAIAKREAAGERPPPPALSFPAHTEGGGLVGSPPGKGLKGGCVVRRVADAVHRGRSHWSV